MILITGPNGNVGEDITQGFATRNDLPEYRIAAHRPDYVRERFGQHVPAVSFDYDDPSTWGSVLEDAQTMFLLFPLPSPRRAKRQMIPFVKAAGNAGVKHFVYVTVPGADHSNKIPHYHVERAIEATGANHTFLRSSYFMQNLVRDISTHGVDIALHDELFIPAKDSITTFVDSRDVGAVALKVLENPSDHVNVAYRLCGPEDLTFDQVAEVLTEVMGRDIRYSSPSFPAFWRRLRKRGKPPSVILFMTIVYTLARRGLNQVEGDDLERLLGRRPTDIRKFAQDYKWRWDQQEWT